MSIETEHNAGSLQITIVEGPIYQTFYGCNFERTKLAKACVLGKLFQSSLIQVGKGESIP